MRTSPTRLVLLMALLTLTVATAPARGQDTPSWNKATPKPAAAAKPKPKPAAPRPKPAAPRPKPKPRVAVKHDPPPTPPAQPLPPLAAQYRVLKVNDNGTQVEVSPVTVFSRGDRLRLAVKSEQEVYLFVIQQKGAGQAGRVYFPDPQTTAGPHLLARDQEFVFPSGCPASTPAHECSYQVDAAAGREVFTIIFSRTPTFGLLDEANTAGGVTQRSLDAFTSDIIQRVDDSPRGDTVFARRFRNLGPRSGDQLVVRFVLNKRG